MNDSITEYIHTAASPHKDIMLRIRELIHQSVPDVKEDFKWGRPIFSAAKDFAYLKTAKAYVTLGFFKFDKLSDPDNLLEGTGKDMRHIKIKSVADINEQLLADWFKTASQS